MTGYYLNLLRGRILLGHVSQPWLHSGITWENVEDVGGHVGQLGNYSSISGGARESGAPLVSKKSCSNSYMHVKVKMIALNSKEK